MKTQIVVHFTILDLFITQSIHNFLSNIAYRHMDKQTTNCVEKVGERYYLWPGVGCKIGRRKKLAPSFPREYMGNKLPPATPSNDTVGKFLPLPHPHAFMLLLWSHDSYNTCNVPFVEIMH